MPEYKNYSCNSVQYNLIPNYGLNIKAYNFINSAE